MISMEKQTLMMIYAPASERFLYCSDMSDLGLHFDDRPLWRIMQEDGIACPETVSQFRQMLLSVAQADVPQAQFAEWTFRHRTLGCRRYRVGFVCVTPGADVAITMTDIAEERSNACETLDALTDLMNRNAFCAQVEDALRSDAPGASAGRYAIIHLDVMRFKAINDLFGRTRGDALLRYIADAIRNAAASRGFASRLTSDHFAVFICTDEQSPEAFLEAVRNALAAYDLPFEVAFNAGIYVTHDAALAANAMIDRAALAQRAIKGRYDVRFSYYTEEMRTALIGAQEIEGMMSTALAEKQFVVYYQPQYNHATGMLVGAEALVRWLHPERGMISPADFIPIFERNGFITNLDLYVFEQVCRFLRKCLDMGWAVVPISSNFSRYDIFLPDFVEKLEAIRKQYDVPSRLLRVEVTESATVGGTQYVNDVIRKLHDAGYVVEMDDFGSGYSSLNVLKDLELDIIKLDMKFLSSDSDNKKGGTILSSVVRMAKWLSMPVIAEGVETAAQADFLCSIGCDYIQGYLYSRPLPEEKYVELISASSIGATVPAMKLIETMNAFNFWAPESMETLIFSNYVGGAAIFDYHDEQVEILRVNKKYLQEFSMNISEKELIESDPLAVFDETNRTTYLDMIHRAIDTMEEQECETWRNITSSCCGRERFCIRSTVRVIGVSGDRYLFHAMVRNVTTEKLYQEAMLDSERRFQLASEQVNIYYWEYNIATREMRPCFRCMRDLGLPPLVRNYPEPLIESGAIPIEVADSYRAWLQQVVEGGPKTESIVPLTDARIPFRFRYTLEYDENGHPIKAYGSAALVVD